MLTPAPSPAKRSPAASECTGIAKLRAGGRNPCRHASERGTKRITPEDERDSLLIHVFTFHG